MELPPGFAVTDTHDITYDVVLANVWRGHPPAPKTRMCCPFVAREWLSGISKLELAERFQKCCAELDALSAKVRNGSLEKERAKELMVPVAEEALAIKYVLG